MLGKNNDFLVPAILGLGLYANNTEMNLANNTSILLILFLLLKGEHCKDGHHGGHHDGDGLLDLRGSRSISRTARVERTRFGDIVIVPDYTYPGAGYPGYGHPPIGGGCGCNPCCNPCALAERARRAISRFDDGCGCGCFDPCDPCGCNRHRHHHHEEKERRHRRREEREERREEKERERERQRERKELIEDIADEVHKRENPQLERIERCACQRRHHHHNHHEL